MSLYLKYVATQDGISFPTAPNAKSVWLGTQTAFFTSKIAISKTLIDSFFLVSFVGERPWWPIQCLNKGRMKKAKG